MLKYRIRFTIILAVSAVLSLLNGIVSAETWRLQPSGGWKAVSAQTEDKYLLAVAEIKQLVSTGQTQAVSEALNKLKTDFPELNIRCEHTETKRRKMTLWYQL